MDAEMTVKQYRVKGTRVLANGKLKEYYYNKSYKVKNGVGDKRVDNNGRPGKLTPDQKAEALLKYKMGVKINRICEDLGVTYGTVNRCLKEAEESKEIAADDKNDE